MSYSSFVVIHLSDLHFHKYPRYNEITLKRLAGSLSLFTHANKEHPISRNLQRVDYLINHPWDYLVISGDLTYLSLESEFRLASQVLSPLLKKYSEKITIIPGNHDRFIPLAQGSEDLFQKYFGEFFPNKKMNGIQLSEKWHLIAWDSTHPNKELWHGKGTVTQDTITNTELYINRFPKDHRFMLANHYPLWHPQGDNYLRKNDELTNLSEIRSWIKKISAIKMYLHGHHHQNWNFTIPRIDDDLTIVNSAFQSDKNQTELTSLFHSITINNDSFTVTPILLKDVV